MAGPDRPLRPPILAGTAGFLFSGLNNVAGVTLADSAVLPSVAAAVIGGTSILGGRGGYAGTMIVLVAGAYTRITTD